MASNPAKPGFRPQSVLNRLTKETVYRGEVELEDVQRELEEYEGAVIFNNGESNYSKPPETRESEDLNDYLDSFHDYEDVAGFSEVFDSGDVYQIYVSLVPGQKTDDEIVYPESENVKMKWRTDLEPDF